MTSEKITEMAKQAGFKTRGVVIRTMHSSGAWVGVNSELKAFAQLVRNAAFDEAKEVCRQVVRETSTTLTWEGCAEIQEALEKEKT